MRPLTGPLGGHLGGHLGAHVSSLVDDQLPAVDAERAWRHVAGCQACQEEVQQELWVKGRLHAAPAPQLPHVPDARLTAALAALTPPEPLKPVGASARRAVRRSGVAALGVGTVSAAVTGLVLLAPDARAPEPVRPSPFSGQPGAEPVIWQPAARIPGP